MHENSLRQDDWEFLLGGARLDDLHNSVSTGNHKILAQGMNKWALAYALARMLPSLNRTVLLITPSARDALQAQQSLSFFLGLTDGTARGPLEHPLWHFPAANRLMPTEAFVAPDIQAQRLAVLYVAAASSSSKIIVASVQAATEKVLPRQPFMDASRYLVVGEQVHRQEFLSHLVSIGYYRTELVEEVGDLSVRGDIIDLYTPLYRQPVRLEFFDDILESIRFFKPATQRSSEHLEDVIVLPAHEVLLTDSRQKRVRSLLHSILVKERPVRSSLTLWLERAKDQGHYPGIDQLLPLYYRQLESLFHYLPASTLVVLSDPGRVTKLAAENYRNAEAQHDAARRKAQWALHPETYLLNEAEVSREIERYPSILQSILPVEHAPDENHSGVLRFRLQGHEGLQQQIIHNRKRHRLLEPLAERLKHWQQFGISPFLVCRTAEQARRMEELLADYGVDARFTSDPFGRFSFRAPVTKVLVGNLHKGFLWPDEGLSVVTETELYGEKVRRGRVRTAETGAFLASFADLQTGNLVVHLDHGIGIYQGLVHLNISGLANDFLLLEYQDGDRLYLPVDRLDRVQKYIGIDGHDPQVDKLGGQRWASTRRRVQQSIQKVAQELLRTYALRQIKEATRFSPPDSSFREFEVSFPYEETPDQQAAIEEVLADMQQAKCMDRLICGDVGFGKTEVALRAAFKAVMDGKQVAVLVPTTVLAEQHFLTFTERLAGYPVFVEVLSRFKSRAEQKKILADLVKGLVDIVIGTHRLLQRDVVFKNLGLLIIDEEHRFGVRHKERIKQLRAEVDVLTLTATPIPRTLHMSLIGIRDLSTIDTPPQDRQAILTKICSFDDQIIREAILKEKTRGGQVFFVHNNVSTIYRMASHIQQLVPQVIVAVAHGQLRERELEQVMLEFVHQRLDVLVCTTIIESGLDIPAANTIFINRADKFGLAQIYQLRGRVGRSSEQAYAYLLIPGEHLVTRQAQRRLIALMDFTELGSGFKIALNDLQIRGAGNILGAAQSGHISAVGYEMYVRLMEKAIAELKGETAREPVEPEIHLNFAAYLPTTYIAESSQRLTLYKRLATAGDETVLADMEDELRDRFGPLPVEAYNLFGLLNLKLLLRRLWIRRLDALNGEFVLTFTENPEIDLDKLADLVAARPRSLRLSPEHRLYVKCGSSQVDESMTELKNLLRNLE
ncbi:MAG: transcription-repair coupling factor [Deltaproteobacteria bacterium]|nr:MAG: transcription-repair coupling factor [Deltaproteobacteria bacterium]